MYQMPVQFGPCCGPRRGPDGTRFLQDGPQRSIQHALVYETRPEALERVLPEGFSVRWPYVIFTHKMHRDLPWLAGRGYNVVTFHVPVTYTGTRETVCGQFLLAIWENHADPILSGREQLGYAKIFAEIEDIRTHRGVSRAALSSWGFRFLEVAFDEGTPPEDEVLLSDLLADRESAGSLHYKYFPRTGDGFSKADVSYVTLTPREFPLPPGVAPPPAAARRLCGGALAWHVPRWEDMPTQFHIVQGLAALPVVRIVGASALELLHYNGVFHQRIVE